MDLFLPPELRLREGWASIKRVKRMDSRTVPCLSVNTEHGFMLHSLAYVRLLMNRTSQGNQELFTSLGSTHSQFADWEAAGAEQISPKTIKDL